MATIKDIALRAGVSHGTVSNVLNKRGNVSAEKITLVEQAARELGFKMNVQAKQLRQGSARRVCVLMPKIGIQCYRDLFEALDGVLREADYDVDIYYTNHLVHQEEKLLEKVMSSNPTAVVLVSTLLKEVKAFNQNTTFVFVDRKAAVLPPGSLFVSFDFFQAGRAMANRCIEDGAGHVALFCGNRKYSNYEEFVQGAVGVLEEKGCRYKVFSADDLMGFHTAFEMVSDRDEFDAVLSSEIENADYFEQAYQYGPDCQKPQIYSLASKGIGAHGHVIPYELNYKLCGRKIAKYIIKSDGHEEISEALLQVGHDGFAPRIKREREKQTDCVLTFLILKSPTSKALQMLIPSFTRRTGIQIKLVEVEYQELYASAKDSEDSSAYDLIRMDMVWLSELGERVLRPFDAGCGEFREITENFSPNLPEDYFNVKGITYALPFDPSVQILYYRKELFEDALIKREFYERYKRQLDVPKNFQEYDEVAEFFTRKYNPNSPTEYGISLVFGSAIAAACDYLPRVKHVNRDIFTRDNDVKVNVQPVKETLRQYMDSYRYTNQNINMWWQNSMQDFADGNVAMSIVFSNHASLMLSGGDSQVIGKIGFASVPGGNPMLGGGVVGISKNTRKHEACMTFLRWIYEEEIAMMITRLGGYINHRELVNNVDILKVYPWIEGMEKAFCIGWRREHDIKKEHFDEFRFEEILGYAVRASAMGIMDMEDALEEAQKKCDRTFGHFPFML